MLVKVKGMFLVEEKDVDFFDFICILVVVWIMMLKFYVCLFVGCEQMNEQMQVLVFMVGVNLIFYGEKLLIMKNLQVEKDMQLFVCFGIKLEECEEYVDEVYQVVIEQVLVE